MGSRARALLSRRTTLLLLFLLAFLPALLGGCGGGGGSQAQSSSRATPSQQGEEAEPQSAEASIEGFGEEAGGTERKAILGSFDGYLQALVKKDYPSACASMAAQLHESLKQLSRRAFPHAGCSQVLPKILSPEAGETARAQLQGTVTKVRLEGERGFVVFHAPGAKLYDMPMVKEGGGWKVAAAAATVLVPEL